MIDDDDDHALTVARLPDIKPRRVTKNGLKRVLMEREQALNSYGANER